MDLQGLQTSKLSEIISFARSQTKPPSQQILPYQLESNSNIENLGEIPIWAMHLYNYKGILRERMYEIDRLQANQSVINLQLTKEYDTLSNLYTFLDAYLQNNLRDEFAEKSKFTRFKVIITDKWQLIGKQCSFG